ncbi:MAG: alkaline phosphatase family protein [Elusimicrobia bacterium]|nr:alkaline phosphatase family protein [Elusimicrobiota bacterium]
MSVSRVDAQIGEVAQAAAEHRARLIVFSDHGQTPTDNFINTFGETPQQLLDKLHGELRFSHVYSMGNVYSRAREGRLDVEESGDLVVFAPYKDGRGIGRALRAVLP